MRPYAHKSLKLEYMGDFLPLFLRRPTRKSFGYVKSLKSVNRWIFTSRSSILTVEQGSVPSFWMTWQFSFWKGSILPPPNGNPTKLYARTVREIGLVVDIEEFLEKGDSGVHLQIYLTEDLKLAQV